MNQPSEIDAVELIGVRLVGDGSRLKVCVRGRDGHVHKLALPAKWLIDLLNAVPQSFYGGEVHCLASWRMEPTAKGDMLLTLRTPEGQAINFTIKSWQAQGMATLATHGRFGRSENDCLN